MTGHSLAAAEHRGCVPARWRRLAVLGSRAARGVLCWTARATVAMGNCMSEPDGGRLPLTGPDGLSGSLSARENAAAAAGVLGADLASAEKFCLTMACNKLPATSAMGGGIEPFVVVYTSGDRLAREMFVNKTELGRTESKSSAPHPHFFTEIVVDWRFEEVQQLHFEVYDADPQAGGDVGVPLDQHEYLGGCSCMLEEVLASPGTRLTLKLTNGVSVAGNKQLARNGSTLTVTADKEPMQNSLAALKLRAKGLQNNRGGLSGLLGQTDPFLRLRRTREAGASYENMYRLTDSMWDQATPCYKSEVYMNSSAPRWRPMFVGVQTLCCGDVERPIVLEVRDWDTDGSHDVIGYAVQTFSELEHARATGRAIALTDPSTNLTSGELFVDEARLEDRPSFLDFVLGGCELNFLVGVDFTASNGDPADPKSLHWMDPDGSSENQYQAAIRAVGEVIENYDADRLFPVFGFGGKFPSLTVRPTSSLLELARVYDINRFLPNALHLVGCQQEEQCHCVNICPGGNPVQGVEGILDAYMGALTSGNVLLHGPTKLGPVLSTACRWAEEADVSQDNQKCADSSPVH